MGLPFKWVVVGVVVLVILLYFAYGGKWWDTSIPFIGLKPLSASLKDSRQYLDGILGGYAYDKMVGIVDTAALVTDTLRKLPVPGHDEPERELEREEITSFTPTIPNEWHFEDITGNKKRERIVRRVLETIYQVPFPTVRPAWLINYQSGARLEIDCFCEDIGDGNPLAVEVSGSQHYREENYFHRGDREVFLKQVFRDRLKKSLILDKGIDLIIVPFTVKLYDIPHYIVDKLKELGKL